MEISNLSVIELRVMIIRMLNSLRKDTETMKNDLSEMKNDIAE